MKNIAILVDLELTTYAGGHVKFWERVCYSIKNSYKKFFNSSCNCILARLILDFTVPSGTLSILLISS